MTNSRDSSELALFGGAPIRTTPVPVWPTLGEEEVAAVTDVLRSGKINYWTGPCGREFEKEWAHLCDTEFAIATGNGTAALELALRAFGIGLGDEVIVPARSFVATASCAVTVGAKPVIVDIDPITNALTAETVAPAITAATRAIIVVHIGGWPADMDPLIDLAHEHGIKVIEDCAQAHGATYFGRPVGGIGDAGCFSFCQDKIVPCGEGGMLVLNEYDAYKRAWEYRDHGKNLERAEDDGCGDDSEIASFRWLVDSFGTNLRLGEMESALGLVGTRKLGAYHATRAHHAEAIIQGLEGTDGIEFARPLPQVEHAYYRLYGRLDVSRLNEGWTRDKVLAAIKAEGTPVQYGSCAELYREQAFIDAGFSPAEPLPGALQAHEESICFFVDPAQSDEDIADTIAATRKVLAVAISE